MGALTWSWIGRRVELEVMEKSLKHLELTRSVAKACLELFQSLARCDAEGVRRSNTRVHEVEGRADEIKREVIKELGKGYIHPVTREELIRLALAVDDIAAFLKGASRRASLIEPREIEDEVRNYALRMAEKVLKAVELLEESVKVLNKDLKKALELADAVERIEEEVDDIRIEALGEVLRFCNKSTPSACIVAKEIIDSLENATDRCEDTADVIRSIAVMR